MSHVNRSVLAITAVMLVLGLAACSTTKNEPAPEAPAPVYYEPKPDRG